MSATSTAICNKLVSDYNSITAPIYAAKAMVRSKMIEVETYLRTMVFTPILDDLNGAIIDFQNNIAAALPKADLGAMNELKQFMDQCLYLNDISPMSIIMGTAAGVNDYMNELIGDNTFPEFGASGLFSDINDSLGTGGVTNSFMQADKLLNCLDSMCPGYGGTMDALSEDLTILYASLNVVGNPLSSDYGKFDTDVVYNNADLTGDQRSAITKVTSGIDGAKSDSAAAIEASASKVQELTKAGDFF